MNLYKKHFKIIFGILLICISISLLSALHILFFTPLYTPSTYSYYDTFIRKDIYAKTLKSKKIIIASGSSSNYGINTETLSRKTDYKILTLGLNQDYPINYLKYKIMKYAKKGDLVILPLEFKYFPRTDNFENREVCERYTTYDKEFLMQLSTFEKIRVLLRTAPLYPLRLRYGLKEMPIHTREEIEKSPFIHILRETKPHYIQYSTEAGERIFDVKPNQFAEYLYKKGVDYPTEDKPSDFFISEIKLLEKELKGMGIELYLTFPPTMINKKFDLSTEETQKELKQLLLNIESSGIKYFGNPYLYHLPLEYFFDSKNHLNARGCILRTLCLADDINKMLKDGAKVDFTPPTQEYIDEKLKEVDVILEDLNRRQDALEAITPSNN